MLDKGRMHKTDFCAVIEFARLRGTRMCLMEDGDGDMSICLVIPTKKNGIDSRRRYGWRWMLSVIRNDAIKHFTHMLMPFVDMKMFKYLIWLREQKGYKSLLPIVGNITPDLGLIDNPPCRQAKTYNELTINGVDALKPYITRLNTGEVYKEKPRELDKLKQRILNGG